MHEHLWGWTQGGALAPRRPSSEGCRAEPRREDHERHPVRAPQHRAPGRSADSAADPPRCAPQGQGRAPGWRCRRLRRHPWPDRGHGLGPPRWRQGGPARSLGAPPGPARSSVARGRLGRADRPLPAAASGFDDRPSRAQPYHLGPSSASTLRRASSRTGRAASAPSAPCTRPGTMESSTRGSRSSSSRSSAAPTTSTASPPTRAR